MYFNPFSFFNNNSVNMIALPDVSRLFQYIIRYRLWISEDKHDGESELGHSPYVRKIKCVQSSEKARTQQG